MLLAGILGLSMLLCVPALGIAGGRGLALPRQSSAQNSDSAPPPAATPPAQQPPSAPTSSSQQPPPSQAKPSVSTKSSSANKTKKTPQKKAPSSADDEAPKNKKKIVSRGGTDEPTTQISASMTPEQAAKSRADAASLLSQTDSNLQKISGRQLTAEEQETVDQIRKFEEQSKSADQLGDLPRAASLANKAKLLSDALLKP